MFFKTFIVAVAIALAPAAYARHSHRGDNAGFATSSCVSFGCYSRHPGGIFRHPLTDPKGESKHSRSYTYPGA